jgi:hypothetical protein
MLTNMPKPFVKLVSRLNPKRRWAQFSLAAMFVVLTALCVWWVVQVKCAHRQQEAVKQIVAMDGAVSYDYEFDPSGAMVPGASPPWLTALVGVDFVCNVRSVSLVGTNAMDADLKCLASLPALESLRLSGTGITERGIMRIGYAPKVRELHLDGTSVEDPYVIGGCFPSLATLDLSRTPAGRRLKNLYGTRAMRRLFLDDLKIGDASLRWLAGWDSLELLSIRGSDATDAGIAEFQRALPNCKIVR